MSIGVWQPSSSNLKAIDLEKVGELVELAGSADFSDLGNSLSKEFIQTENALMKKKDVDWACLSELGNDELILLVRFFTLAEMQLTGWEGGSLSPVIYIVKILKQRKIFDSELRKWVKANTDNRYLPNGAIL